MKSNVFSKELMDEVKALQESIREICPEIDSVKNLADLDQFDGDEMNALISHRIQILSETRKSSVDFNSQ